DLGSLSDPPRGRGPGFLGQHRGAGDPRGNASALRFGVEPRRRRLAIPQECGDAEPLLPGLGPSSSRTGLGHRPVTVKALDHPELLWRCQPSDTQGTLGTYAALSKSEVRKVGR